MKKYVIAIIFLLLLPSFSAERMDESLECSSATDEFFTPENITLKDDAFHVFPLHAETWYYECFFDNDYSMVFIVTVLSNGRTGLALAGIYIYRNTHLEYSDRIFIPSPFFFASDKKPLIKIFGKEIINGDIDKEGNLYYNILFENNGYGISLTFINETRGWKGKMGRGWWLAVPKCKVRGTLVINDEKMEVEGIGYHDHNIFHLYTPLVERGYIDGKLLAEPSIVWGEIFHTRWNSDAFAVISYKGKYISIPQKNITIKEDSYIYDHGRFIPTEVNFSFNVGNEMEGFLHVKAEDFHHIRLPLLWYWRYHVRVEGKIKIGKDEIEVNKIEMMELMIY
ncbi:hypothetical protein B6U81_00655 [Thermoplasmatales archaeon ex4484_30]|nr:MAG: hypothetical protein B6U81_00655 [Thermoplasmatales archaeon ex4484_30]RLI62888.1 MAG: hypothetical protein DRO67_06665 [Candidatus Asgardarchaeum californiense]